uniref:Receptor kinase-like protein Xa21 n=1 Tax=Ananas comosus var. bracteatus TaxID=296719 RepID=A0A6V7P107_ANACO|nr:unnamed protein product [Ananas comosus var. bracteatus]
MRRPPPPGQSHGLELVLAQSRRSLPPTVANLTFLKTLDLSNNQLDGQVPVQLGRLSRLQYLDLSHNSLRGSIPMALGRCSALETIALGYNQLEGEIPPDLANLSSLTYLNPSDNTLSGQIPLSLGRIPPDVGESLPRLEGLFMYHNQFRGPIPASLANATRLSDIEIDTNFFSGTIPPEIGSLQLLQKLLLYKNSLEVKEPDDWGFFTALTNCSNLQYLALHSNKLSGLLPTSISNLSVSIEFITLGSNSLSVVFPKGLGTCGNIPKTLGNLRNLQQLDLSYNKLSGMIPEEVMAISSLSEGLVLSHNLLVGRIPSEVGNLKNLEMLDVKENKLSGTIPSTLGECQVLQFLYAQMNSLHGSIPSSFRALKATDGFSATNLIGTGSYGSVYKGVLEGEGEDSVKVVAVKVLNLQTPGSLKSFTAECEAMKNLRHRNLVRIITLCSSSDYNGNEFKALVFEFMPNGSLEDWLHHEASSQAESKHLSLLQRLNIAIDVASALDYLHCHSGTPIVHRDLKPSNVLLDDDMVAHVGDFGLARIRTAQKSASSIGFKGSIGYVAPEYGAGNRVSAHGDIYSFGILLMEMMTGIRPTDNIFKEDLSLHRYVEIAFPDRVIEIVDARLLAELADDEDEAFEEEESTGGKAFQCIVSLLRVGLMCSKQFPTERMLIGDVIKELHVVREMLLGKKDV